MINQGNVDRPMSKNPEKISYYMSSSRYEFPVMLMQLTYDVSKGHDVEGRTPPPQPGQGGYGHQATHYGTQGVGTTCNWGH